MRELIWSLREISDVLQVCNYYRVYTDTDEGSGDLKSVVDKINGLLSTKYQDYLIDVGDNKMRLPRYLKRPIVRDLFTKVSIHALKLMEPQWLLLLHRDTNGPLSPCTRTFSSTLGLPCAHIMEQRLAHNGGVLKLEDIHSHWYLENPEGEDAQITPNSLTNDAPDSSPGTAAPNIQPDSTPNISTPNVAPNIVPNIEADVLANVFVNSLAKIQPNILANAIANIQPVVLPVPPKPNSQLASQLDSQLGIEVHRIRYLVFHLLRIAASPKILQSVSHLETRALATMMFLQTIMFSTLLNRTLSSQKAGLLEH